MPTYTYTGDEGRYYPTLGLSPEPDGTYDLDRNPDPGRFTPPDAAAEPASAETPAPKARAASKNKEA